MTDLISRNEEEGMSDTPETIDPHSEKYWADAEEDSETLAGYLGAYSWFHFGEPNPTSELMRQGATRIRKLDRELAAAIKDAERYRHCVIAGLLDGDVEAYCATNGLDEAGECNTPEYKALADAAIDARIAEREK